MNLTRAIPTGYPELDEALGVGGFPRGHIVEVYGPEASGKSTLALKTIAATQATDQWAAFVDTEHSFDTVYAESLGVKLGGLLYLVPDSGNQALDMILQLIDKVQLIIVDSAAALVPEAELLGDLDDESFGAQSTMMAQSLRDIKTAAVVHNTAVVFFNQIRNKLQARVGDTETTPGGRPLKMYSSIRVDLRPLHRKRGKTSKIRATVVKNKMAAPMKTATFHL